MNDEDEADDYFSGAMIIYLFIYGFPPVKAGYNTFVLALRVL
jgi:hypothetical protein